ncbi:MAG: glycosyltransferase [Hespellia sp.]|nr:glycosyltransferase [Hespellia sp.]
MRILHYALGFPPYRTGGLTKYCMDLMIEQKQQGHDVGMLWPGRMGVGKENIKIRKTVEEKGILSFELIHPLPVPLDEGILDVDKFMDKTDGSLYRSFLLFVKPNVIHVHTLMGIHLEFFKEAKKLNIPIYFTTHDFFGICSKATFLNHGENCKKGIQCEDCFSCNQSALSNAKIRLMQSVLYRALKDTAVVKKMRQRHRSDFFEQAEERETIDSRLENKSEDYLTLRNYYKKMFFMMDGIHFNSTVTESVYRQYLEGIKGEVISISNGEIQNHKIKKQFGNKVKMAFLAAPSPAKGYFEIVGALDELWKEGYHDFELHSYGNSRKDERYLKTHPRYQFSDLKNIMEKTDLVVVPSMWNETFGFVVLEALSYGVPVLVSEHVGAKDILAEGKSGMIARPDKESLKNAVKDILRNPQEKLSEMNHYIVKNQFIKTMDVHAKEIEKFYKG